MTPKKNNIGFWQKISSLTRQHRYGLTLLAFLSAAAITGIVCVYFMRAFDFVLMHRLDFNRIGWWCFITTPLLFIVAVELIRRFAPFAEGTGIPQVVFVSEHLNTSNQEALLPLISSRTFIIKIAALLIGLWAGASTGREGPTVHLAACVFFGVLMLFRRFLGLNFDLRSAVVAGGAAGLAAAFNTPLAGVTFAVEELSTDYFSAIKDYVVMSIIFASLAAIWLTGEYSYFGKLTDPLPIPMFAVVLIGVVAGILSAFFSTAIIKGSQFLSTIKYPWFRYGRPAIFSIVLLLLAVIGGPHILGPGNKVAQELLGGMVHSNALVFALTKMAGTLASYWSGIAGGIFAPCLAIGASLGSSMGLYMGLPVATCALIGMAAFLSGTIQAPLTAFVIIFEMTGHHEMLVPTMLASLTAYIVARSLKAKHLYGALAENYRPVIAEKKPA